MFALWCDRIEDNDKLDEFIDWVNNGDGGPKAETVSNTAFLMGSDGEIG